MVPPHPLGFLARWWSQASQTSYTAAQVSSINILVDREEATLLSFFPVVFISLPNATGVNINTTCPYVNGRVTLQKNTADGIIAPFFGKYILPQNE